MILKREEKIQNSILKSLKFVACISGISLLLKAPLKPFKYKLCLFFLFQFLYKKFRTYIRSGFKRIRKSPFTVKPCIPGERFIAVMQYSRIFFKQIDNIVYSEVIEIFDHFSPLFVESYNQGQVFAVYP